MIRYLPCFLPVLLLASCGGDATVDTQQTTMLSAARQSASITSEPIIFPYQRAAYIFVPSGTGNIVRLVDDPSDQGKFVPANAVVRFSDISVLPYTEDGNLGKAYRLYQAAFARTPDANGLRFWFDQLNIGASPEAIAQGFIDSAEFQSRYGSNPKDPSIITGFYRNVLGRVPDAGGLMFWQDMLQQGNVPLAEILMSFSESAENKTIMAPKLMNGIGFNEDAIPYSGAVAPQSALKLSVSGKRYAGSTLTVKLDASSPMPASATYAWSLMSKPSGSKTQVNATTPILDFTPDVPGIYYIGLVVADNGRNTGASIKMNVTAERLLNKPYIAKNGMTIKLESVVIADHGSNYVDYTFTYVQTNDTQLPIEEGALKLYFQKAAPLAQYGFFNKLYPGDTLRRAYTFTQLKSEAPAVLEYDQDNFFRNEPALDSLQWPIPLN